MSEQIGRFAKLIEDHFTRLRATLAEDRASDWTRSVLQRVLDNELWSICLLGEGKMAQSMSDGERHSASELVDDLFISISTFPCSLEEAKQKHYRKGYLPYLDRMVSMGRQENPHCHWLHFQFFCDGTIFAVQFTLFPNRHVLEFAPRYHLPIECLSDEEKRKTGLQ